MTDPEDPSSSKRPREEFVRLSPLEKLKQKALGKNIQGLSEVNEPIAVEKMALLQLLSRTSPMDYSTVRRRFIPPEGLGCKRDSKSCEITGLTTDGRPIAKETEWYVWLFGDALTHEGNRVLCQKERKLAWFLPHHLVEENHLYMDTAHYDVKVPASSSEWPVLVNKLWDAFTHAAKHLPVKSLTPIAASLCALSNSLKENWETTNWFLALKDENMSEVNRLVALFRAHDDPTGKGIENGLLALVKCLSAGMTPDLLLTQVLSVTNVDVAGQLLEAHGVKNPLVVTSSKQYFGTQKGPAISPQRIQDLADESMVLTSSNASGSLWTSLSLETEVIALPESCDTVWSSANNSATKRVRSTVTNTLDGKLLKDWVKYLSQQGMRASHVTLAPAPTQAPESEGDMVDAEGYLSF